MNKNILFQHMRAYLGATSYAHYLTTSEAAKQIGVARSTISEWVTAGKLRCFRTDKMQMYFKIEDLNTATRDYKTHRGRRPAGLQVWYCQEHGNVYQSEKQTTCAICGKPVTPVVNLNRIRRGAARLYEGSSAWVAMANEALRLRVGELNTYDVQQGEKHASRKPQEAPTAPGID